MEAGFEEQDVLQDDARPQHVAQYPVRRNLTPHAERIRRGPSKGARGEDREMVQAFDPTMTEPQLQPAFLYVERGPGQGQLVPVVNGTIVLGRSSTADFRLQHPSISRRHAQFRRHGGQFFIKDLESQNGTFVNRMRVTHEVEVSTGDQIALGTVLLKLRGSKPGAESQLTTVAEDEENFSTGEKKRKKVWVILAGSVALGLLGCLTYLLLFNSQSPRQAEVASNAATVTPKPERVAAPALGMDLAGPPPAEAPTVTRDAIRVRRSVPQLVPVAAARPSAPKVARVELPASRVHAVEDAPPATSEESPAHATAIRAKYEEGNAQAALALARKAHAADWVKKLSRFTVSYEAAQAALSTHDVETASKYIQRALDADEQIAEGWGTYNAELRSELTAIGARTTPHAKVPPPAAKTAPAAAPPVAPAKKSAIDAAFDD